MVGGRDADDPTADDDDIRCGHSSVEHVSDDDD
jgi:hypothetical protein